MNHYENSDSMLFLNNAIMKKLSDVRKDIGVDILYEKIESKGMLPFVPANLIGQDNYI